MADTVRRIGNGGFKHCVGLKFIKLSRNLESIGIEAFQRCESLTSIFIPPTCREIGGEAFRGCKKLIILNVPPSNTFLTGNVIADTALIRASRFVSNKYTGEYENYWEVNPWIKNLNQGDEYAMHRACSSFNPLMEIISEIVKRDGLQCFKKENEVGITPLEYLDVNPFAEIDQIAIAKRYVLEMMGEIL